MNQITKETRKYIPICCFQEKYKKYSDYLKKEDINGYMPLHYAATAGSYKVSKHL